MNAQYRVSQLRISSLIGNSVIFQRIFVKFKNADILDGEE
jgi:hypothetical protein